MPLQFSPLCHKNLHNISYRLAKRNLNNGVFIHFKHRRNLLKVFVDSGCVMRFAGRNLLLLGQKKSYYSPMTFVNRKYKFA